MLIAFVSLDIAQHFTEALLARPRDAVVLSCRAAARLRAKKFMEALEVGACISISDVLIHMLTLSVFTHRTPTMPSLRILLWSRPISAEGKCYLLSSTCLKLLFLYID
jgi:hypothetical protein